MVCQEQSWEVPLIVEVPGKSHRATNWLHSAANTSSVQKLTPTTHTPPVKLAQGKLPEEILVNGIVLNIPQVSYTPQQH